MSRPRGEPADLLLAEVSTLLGALRCPKVDVDHATAVERSGARGESSLWFGGRPPRLVEAAARDQQWLRPGALMASATVARRLSDVQRSTGAPVVARGVPSAVIWAANASDWVEAEADAPDKRLFSSGCGPSPSHRVCALHAPERSFVLSARLLHRRGFDGARRQLALRRRSGQDVARAAP